MNVVTNNKWIGQRTIRPDGVDKVTGRAAFAADTNMPGMICARCYAARIRLRASSRSTPRRRSGYPA